MVAEHPEDEGLNLARGNSNVFDGELHIWKEKQNRSATFLILFPVINMMTYCQSIGSSMVSAPPSAIGVAFLFLAT